jgi:hypothetical protein
VAADDSEPGVLGNLPRSRPGRRSTKRSAGATPRKQPAAGASSKRGATATRAAATTPRAKRSTGARSSASTRPPRSAASERPAPQPSRQGGDDPLTQAVRLGVKVAETGVKTAVGLLKRLPGAPR